MIDYAMSDAAYHARNELSSTGARSLLPEFGGSPAKFKYKQGREFNSPAFDIGKAVHAKVLGVGAQAVAYPDDVLASNGAASTKAAKEWSESVRAEGMVPMKAADLAPINNMAEAVLANEDARGILERLEHRETSIFTQAPEGIGVRARFDIYGDGEAGDLKTCQDASPKGFLASVVKYGYFVQEGFYRDAYKFETGQELGRFHLIAVETSGPYQAAVHELDVMFRDIGQGLAKTARETYAQCLETDTWPGVKGELLAPPTWMVYEHEGTDLTL